ncbi:unnamed protein product [Urochloa humidicola]
MPRRGGKVKIQWIVQRSVRQATFRKRHTTLFDKARDLSILCGVPAAVIVYGNDGQAAEPKVWPGVEEVREILQRHRDLPDSLKEAHKLDNERFVRRRTGKMRRKVDTCKTVNRRLEVNLVLNDVGLGRRQEFDDLPREVADAVMSALDALRNVVADRVSFFRSGGATHVAAAALPASQVEGAAALMALSLQEPLMVPPLAVAVPTMVPNAPLFVQPAPPQSALVVVPAPPAQEEVEEPPMVTPLAMAPMVPGAPVLLMAPEPEPIPPQSQVIVTPAPPLQELPVAAGGAPLLLPAPEPEPAPLQPELLVVVAPAPLVPDVPLLLPAPELEPEPAALPQSEILVAPPPTVADTPLLLPALAPQGPTMVADGSDAPLLPAAEPETQHNTAGVGVDEPLNLDAEPRNGSFLLEMADAIMDDGSGRQATAEDVERLLREHGLEHFKPM